MAFTFISAPTGQANFSTNSLALTFNIASGDDLAVLTLTIDSSSDLVTSVTDSQGANWTQAHNFVGGPTRAYCFFTTDLSTTGNRTITINTSSNTNIAAAGAVFSGAEASPEDVNTGGTDVSGSIQFSVTANNDDDLIIMGVGTSENDTYSSPGAGQVIAGQAAQGGSPSRRVSHVCTYEIVTASGSNLQSISGRSGQWAAVGVTFNAEAVAAGDKRIFVVT